jgi:hypothetical protein
MAGFCVIFAAADEHWIRPFDAKEPEPRSNRACALTLSTDAERVVAATFSRNIREYSAGEHLPRAIICPRRPIVSQDANAISIIIKGNGTDFLRRRFLMVRK